MEKVNARCLESLPEAVDVATFDVSFISLKLVIPPVLSLLKPQGSIVALIKPQFEAGRRQVGKGGVVKDPGVHREVLLGFIEWAKGRGLSFVGLMPSPIRGPAGNAEFPIYLRLGAAGPEPDVVEVVERCLSLVHDREP